MPACSWVEIVLSEFQPPCGSLAKRPFYLRLHFALAPGEQDGSCASSCVELFLGDVDCKASARHRRDSGHLVMDLIKRTFLMCGIQTR